MKCKFCGKEFEPTNPMARNIKYCGKKCAGKAAYKQRGGAEYQRIYLDKVRMKDGKLKLQCKICGKWYRQVGSHIFWTHGCTAREYREEYGFDVKRGQLPEDYRELKGRQSIECGGVKNLRAGKKYWFKPGQKGIGIYKRSPQTLARLKVLHKFVNQVGNAT